MALTDDLAVGTEKGIRLEINESGHTSKAFIDGAEISNHLYRIVTDTEVGSPTKVALFGYNLTGDTYVIEGTLKVDGITEESAIDTGVRLPGDDDTELKVVLTSNMAGSYKMYNLQPVADTDALTNKLVITGDALDQLADALLRRIELLLAMRARSASITTNNMEG